MTQQYTALIIDDEALARETLTSYIQKYCPTITVLAQAENIILGKELIAKHQPDILFLDIEMPFGNAFDLLESKPSGNFEVIFVTAFSQYAIQALNMSAAHYLLKPIDIDELIDAVSKVKTIKSEKAQIDRASILINNLNTDKTLSKKIVLPQMHGFEVKHVDSIIYCEAEENFTKFHFNDQTSSLICRQLKHYETILNDQGFHRIHRSTLVNLNYVDAYQKGRGGQVTLSNGKVLDVSESKKKGFLEKFGL
jgi:two-component system LytT family response regulator